MELAGFVGACGVVFGALLGTGGLIVGRPVEAAVWMGVFAGGLVATAWAMRKLSRAG